MKHSQRNLGVIENFILYLTHSGNHAMDAHFKEVQEWTPELMYKAAKDYIREDHVDGEDNPEDEIIPIKFWVESSFVHEDKDREYPEQLTVAVDKGYEGTQSLATFQLDAKGDIEGLIEEINDLNGVNNVYCNKYVNSEVLPDEDGNCSLCGGDCNNIL